MLMSPGDQYYSSVLEEIEFEGKDFKADSWSTAVDSSYLQSHRKDVIKRQDVIYGDCTSFPYTPYTCRRGGDGDGVKGHIS